MRRTKFMRRDVMWSSDFMELPDKSKLLKTLDEMSRYRLGWELVKSESAQDLVVHAWQIIERMGRKPLVWKFDHGSAFMSQAFRAFLADQQIVPYPIPPRAPWVNGRTERDNKEVRNWLIPVEKRQLDAQAWEREIDEGMWMLNFIKPRAVLGFKSSASVYFEQPAIPEPDRVSFLAELRRLKTESGKSFNSERIHRKAVRRLLQDWKLYEEWLPEAET
ncbi:MAG: transposase family protein, partial [Elusimicrobia bacterium]|nr:transposase family protein [Elusimicrobiota bacterium]